MIYKPLIKQGPSNARKSQIDEAIRDFEAKGKAGPDSINGTLLCHILNHCVESGISFRLTFYSSWGYYVERLPNDHQDKRMF